MVAAVAVSVCGGCVFVLAFSAERRTNPMLPVGLFGVVLRRLE